MWQLIVCVSIYALWLQLNFTTSGKKKVENGHLTFNYSSYFSVSVKNPFFNIFPLALRVVHRFELAFEVFCFRFRAVSIFLRLDILAGRCSIFEDARCCDLCSL